MPKCKKMKREREYWRMSEQKKIKKRAREREKESECVCVKSRKHKNGREKKRGEGARFRSSSKAGKDLLPLLSLLCDSSQVSQDVSAKLQTSVKRRRCRRCSVQRVPARRYTDHPMAYHSFSTIAIARRHEWPRQKFKMSSFSARRAS